jgi:hypothetical protein
VHRKCRNVPGLFQSRWDRDGRLRDQTLVISRDKDNTTFYRGEMSIVDGPPAKLGDEPNITDPNQSNLYLGYQDLFEIVRHAENATAIQGGLNGRLSAA